MSSEILKEAGSLARQAATRAAWRQWSSLRVGALTAEEETIEFIIDPEALVLVSLAMLGEERRLADMLAWWARVGSRLLSVQRMKVVAEAYPKKLQERLGRFARSAVEAKDARWRRYAAGEPLGTRGRVGKEVVVPDLSSLPALLLRLRAGFGVSAKPDVLTFLMGIGSRAATVQEIECATGYSGVTVRDATRDLILARFIRKAHEHPVRYYAQRKQWTEFVDLGGQVKQSDMPAWRFWKSVFAFLAHVDELSRSCTEEPDSEYVQSSRARDVFLSHQSAFTNNRIDAPDPGDYRGAAYLVAFRDSVRALVDSIAQRL